MDVEIKEEGEFRRQMDKVLCEFVIKEINSDIKGLDERMRRVEQKLNNGMCESLKEIKEEIKTLNDTVGELKSEIIKSVNQIRIQWWFIGVLFGSIVMLFLKK